MQLKPISQQTIVIVGASSGIGHATARKAGAAGARVVAAARNRAALEQLVAGIEAAGGEAMAVVADVAQPDDVQRVAERAMERFGGFDTWFNQAGTTIFGKTEEVSLQDHRRLFDINYWGVVHGSLAALPFLREHGGTLINMGSMLSDVSAPLHGPYNATKHAIKALTDTIRMELRHDGAPVSVTLVKPAGIDTPLEEHATNYRPVRTILPPPAYTPDLVADAVLRAAQQPMREVVIGEAAEILLLANRFWPAAAERFMESSLSQLQQTDQPAGGQQPNLYRDTTGGRERGDHPLVVGDSPYTRFSTAPAVAATAALASGWMTAPWAWGGWMLASTLKPLVRRRER